MKKQPLIFTDLTKKQLEFLKEIYIQKKVGSMDLKELQKFVLEVITHQITDTIDKEEEMEAWKEMSDFFGNEFEQIINEIQQKYKNDEISGEVEINPQTYRQELLAKHNLENEQKDMWVD